MARGATKAANNVWYQARIEASKWNDKLASRAGAAEEANMSEDAIKNTELGIEKAMTPQKALIFADLYNCPQLLNYYCLHECPIGKDLPLSDQLPSIDRVTVKLLKAMKLEELEEAKDKLLEISEDGVVSEDELPELQDVVDYLDKISKTVSELRSIGEKALGDAEIEDERELKRNAK